MFTPPSLSLGTPSLYVQGRPGRSRQVELVAGVRSRICWQFCAPECQGVEGDALARAASPGNQAAISD